MTTNTTRRNFLLALAAGGPALGVGWNLGVPLQAIERAALDVARKQAAWRRRRIIFNNDGDDIWGKGADTVEKFLAVRHTPLLGTQVDSIYYCTTQSFNLFTHATKVAEIFLSREGAFADNNLPAFLEHGLDGLRMSCEFAHQHGLESMWTLRMNDIHDAWTPQFVSRWKKEAPRRVMASLPDVLQYTDRRRLWSLVDFEHPDVEPQLKAIIEELLRNYPVDGVELDFLRAPFYFRTTYEGQPATNRQIGVLSRIVETIRKVVIAESERQGKPFLLAARVPVTQSHCRYIGIDIANWLSAGWIDVLALGGGYIAFDQPAEALIALAHQHGVPAYPCLSMSGLLYRPPRGSGQPQPPAAWNGASARLWAAGADGIYVFNLFPGPGPPEQREYAIAVLGTIGSVESISRAEQMFAVCDAGWSMPAHYWAKDAEEFSHALPVARGQQKAITVPLVVAKLPNTSDMLPPTELRLDFSDLPDNQMPTVWFNGQQLQQPVASDVVAQVRRLSYRIAANVARTGKNDIRIEGVSDTVKLAGAELWIRPSTR